VAEPFEYNANSGVSERAQAKRNQWQPYHKFLGTDNPWVRINRHYAEGS
jgi:hypothetical protein